MPAMSAMASEYHSYRYAHLRTLTVLIKQRDELARKEEEERKTRDAQFPQSIAQFIALPNDIQVRVARFLTSADAGKEQMLSAFGWAWRQVRPLMGDFAQNVRVRCRCGSPRPAARCHPPGGGLDIPTLTLPSNLDQISSAGEAARERGGG